jgi:2-polyprenyl-3-methyl-5-hydroxy-6-metoxy-1,4-benzoquinol methylase
MNNHSINLIAELNRNFYRGYAQPFAQTRGKIQPGVRRLLETLPANMRILDVGCGSAPLIDELAASHAPGLYVGMDSSAELLHIASTRAHPFPMEFHAADLLSPSWNNFYSGKPFDRIFLFAVLHHIPGYENRLSILRSLADMLEPKGQVWMSNWQFQRNPALVARVIPWTTLGIEAQELEEGDFLLDWREGGYSQRYVHVISENERGALAGASGFYEKTFFFSDGKWRNGSDYSIWEKFG